MEHATIGDYTLKRLGLEARQKPDWSEWEKLVSRARIPKPSVNISLVGKYVELHDAYMSVREALKHAGLQLGVEVEILWVHSSELEKGRCWEDVQQRRWHPGGPRPRPASGSGLAQADAEERFFGHEFGDGDDALGVGHWVVGEAVEVKAAGGVHEEEAVGASGGEDFETAREEGAR
jgi:hypothetical protein